MLPRLLPTLVRRRGSITLINISGLTLLVKNPYNYTPITPKAF